MATFDIFNPTDQNRHLRDVARRFAGAELEPQASARDENEEFSL